jgi:hypothetical protein
LFLSTSHKLPPGPYISAKLEHKNQKLDEENKEVAEANGVAALGIRSREIKRIP